MSGACQSPGGFAAQVVSFGRGFTLSVAFTDRLVFE